MHGGKQARAPAGSCGAIDGAPGLAIDIPFSRASNQISTDDLSTDKLAKLRELAKFMHEHNCSVRIEGYRDASGANREKAKLDEARARSLATYLEKLLLGLGRPAAKGQVTPEGKGEPPEAGLSAEQKMIARILL